MIYIYNIFIRIYGLLIFIVSPFHKKANLLLKGRKNLFQTLPNLKNKNIIWVHCSSLGEYEQAAPILKKIKLDNKFSIFLTFSSPSGYENKKDNYIGDFISYIPLDTKSEMRRFIRKIRPKKVLIIKYEFWPNMLIELNKMKIPTFSVSSIFRENHFVFLFYGKWLKNILSYTITHFLVQDQNSKELLQENGITNTTVVGDSRFDRVIENELYKKNIPIIKEFKNNQKLIVCGSTWPKDIDIILKLAKKNPELKFIIAPHEMDHLKNMNFGIKLSNAKNSLIKKEQILIIDCIGLLSSLYQYGDLAYIGGGFNKGIHNTLEAAVFGLYTIFGPKYEQFKEAKDLIENGFALSINNFTELNNAKISFAEVCPNDQIKAFCQENSGASQKSTNFILG